MSAWMRNEDLYWYRSYEVWSVKLWMKTDFYYLKGNRPPGPSDLLLHTNLQPLFVSLKIYFGAPVIGCHGYVNVLVTFPRTALQWIHKCQANASKYNFYRGGPSHAWVSYYNDKMTTDEESLAEWYVLVLQKKAGIKLQITHIILIGSFRKLQRAIKQPPPHVFLPVYRSVDYEQSRILGSFLPTPPLEQTLILTQPKL